MVAVVWDTVVQLWGVLAEMAPYLLFGFLVAGVLSLAFGARTVERHLGGEGLAQVFKASLLGVPLPLCSCGVIPVAASLRRHHAGRGATAAFLLSTPQTGVDSILVTLALLGPAFAVFRPVAALVSGFACGVAVMFLGRGGPSVSADSEVCHDECCSPAAEGGRLRRMLIYGFVTLPRDIARPLVIGLVAAGLISAAVPDDYFAGLLGHGIASMLVMMAVGIPIYVCATASVPMAAALIAKGVSPGAALVFLMTGPATNVATVTTVWKIMGRRTALVYLLTVAATALSAGLLMDWALASSDVDVGSAAAHMLPASVRTASALVLLAVLGFALRKGSHEHTVAPQRTDGRSFRLSIKGMRCSHCADSIRREMLGCKGVEAASVSHETGQALVSGPGPEEDELRAAVRALGYELTAVEELSEGALKGGGDA